MVQLEVLSVGLQALLILLRMRRSPAVVDLSARVNAEPVPEVIRSGSNVTTVQNTCVNTLIGISIWHPWVEFQQLHHDWCLWEAY